jgi:hypothetical protein
MQFLMLHFYISAFLTMCAVPNMAVFCSYIIIIILLLLLLNRYNRGSLHIYLRQEN